MTTMRDEGALHQSTSLGAVPLYAAIGTADGTSALSSDSASGDASGVLSSLGGTSCQNLPTADDQSPRISDPRFEPAKWIQLLCQMHDVRCTLLGACRVQTLGQQIDATA